MSPAFPHRHLVSIDALSRAEIETVLELAARYAETNRRNERFTRLAGRIAVNLFFENSTRTRTSFEIAARRLGADVVNVPIEHSSAKKGESLLDTVMTIDAMRPDLLIVRHVDDGTPATLAKHVKAHLINAGDGKNEHPTQALLDALTILRHKKKLEGLTVAYCGDLKHSRVAGSFIRLMHKFGNRVRVATPAALATDRFAPLGVEISEDVERTIAGADVVMTQRIQLERLSAGAFSMDLQEYHRRHGLTHQRLKAAKPDVIVLDPGPVIRDMTISDALADEPAHSVIREQVELGVAVRMAVMDLLAGGA